MDKLTLFLMRLKAWRMTESLTRDQKAELLATLQDLIDSGKEPTVDELDYLEDLARVNSGK